MLKETSAIARNAYVRVEIFNCPDFAKCEIVMKEDNFVQNGPNIDKKYMSTVIILKNMIIRILLTAPTQRFRLKKRMRT